MLGFIGLGMMGAPMAGSLVAKGFGVLTHDAAGVRVEGARSATHAGAVAEACETVILMLPDSAAVGSVLTVILPALRANAVVIDMGSSDPAETRHWAQLLSDRGASLLDAPVSGSVPKARAGTLSIMVGGEEEAFQRAEPVLRAMGETIIRTGAAGSAHAMKALNNYVYAAGLLAVSEAAMMAERLGLDQAVFAQVLNASSGRNVATETKLAQEITSRRYAGGFQLGLMRKDLATVASIARETGVQADALALCRALWDEAVAARGARADNTEIHRFLEERTE
ncbi:MAG: NAD(P)-dependent oxidoreductase [Acetobacteraceae bacterium]|nr:NAD(P)-dependent oxidoreductase [Acetobacteraceae bacterium]